MKNILVIEDSKLINKVITKQLSEYGFTVKQAYRLSQAKELLENDTFDLIVLDLHLPDGDGQDLIKNIQSLTKTKVIVLTSYHDDYLRDKLFGYGILDYIIKDHNLVYSINEIIKTINSIDKEYKDKVLVIDDSKFVYKQIKTLLEPRNYIVDSALTAKDGLFYLYQNDFDLIILDMELPDMHGLKLLELIRRYPKWMKIPIIVVSGTLTNATIRNILKNGANDFLKKPFVFEEFILKVELWIDYFKKAKTILEKTQEVEVAHKNIKDSINYASLIQNAIVSKEDVLNEHFDDYFLIWQPRDTVGGDIFIFEELRNKDELLIMVIDCTGHGVAGAFVTMIVKTIEREIVANIKKHQEFDISPAIIMGYLNKTMKKLLQQEDSTSKSNVGFDGGIIYYNKATNILKFCGAETPLFYVDEKGEYNVIKGNRYSVGYKKCKIDYEYKETILEVKNGMKFYLTTDGFLDQNGGEKGFPFGKKRFGNIIKENSHKAMIEQKYAFLETMNEYEHIMKENNDRNDDMTVVGFKV